MLAILPRPAAEFNQSTLLIDSDPLDSGNPADYYAGAVTNHYRRIMHADQDRGARIRIPL
jgi:hypothetical protein